MFYHSSYRAPRLLNHWNCSSMFRYTLFLGFLCKSQVSFLIVLLSWPLGACTKDKTREPWSVGHTTASQIVFYISFILHLLKSRLTFEI